MPISSDKLTEHGLRNAIFMQKIVDARRSVGLETPDLPSVPTLPDEATRKLRAKLILEEAIETVNALGFAIDLPVKMFDLDDEIRDGLDPAGLDVECVDHVGDVCDVGIDEIDLVPRFEPNFAEIVDGCADVSVVTVGTLIACGVGDRPVLECVDANNDAKFGPGHTIRADGKLIKPPGHTKADFAGLLDKLSDG